MQEAALRLEPNLQRDSKPPLAMLMFPRFPLDATTAPPEVSQA